jgi:hypothetical protein
MYHALNRVMDNLRLRVPGSVDGALKIELLNAVDQFLSDTNAWRETIAIPLTSGVTEYEITPTENSSIVRLMAVTDANGNAINASMPIPGTITLASDPGENTSYNAEVALTISGTETRDGYPTAPEWIWDRYGPDLLEGTLSLLFAQVAKPYSNERMAVYHARKFSDAISRARVDSNRQHTYSAQRWRFPQTFAVR